LRHKYGKAYGYTVLKIGADDLQAEREPGAGQTNREGGGWLAREIRKRWIHKLEIIGNGVAMHIKQPL
jgi:hypothetical protein